MLKITWAIYSSISGLDALNSSILILPSLFLSKASNYVLQTSMEKLYNSSALNLKSLFLSAAYNFINICSLVKAGNFVFSIDLIDTVPSKVPYIEIMDLIPSLNIFASSSVRPTSLFLDFFYFLSLDFFFPSFCSSLSLPELLELLLGRSLAPSSSSPFSSNPTFFKILYYLWHSLMLLTFGRKWWQGSLVAFEVFFQVPCT